MKKVYTILVNKKHKYNPLDYEELKYIKIKSTTGEDIIIEKKTYKKFMQLKKEVRKQKIDIGIKYALRNIKEQQKLYNDYCHKYGKDYANKIVAPVKASEHHTGLAIDIEINQNNKWISNNDFFQITEPILKKIHPFLSKYGFILRYPKHKENITGVTYEPWHIRYVGKKLAHFLENNDLVLEEYKNK